MNDSQYHMINPIIYTESEGNNDVPHTIIRSSGKMEKLFLRLDGNHRLAAAYFCGLSEFDCIENPFKYKPNKVYKLGYKNPPRNQG